MPGQEPQSGEPAGSIYMPYGASGGGGQGGSFVFADLDHLDSIITRWSSLRDDIDGDGYDIDEAVRKIVPPAEDEPSVVQANAARASLLKGRQHNAAMFNYVNGFIEKLRATRAQYADSEEHNADTVGNVNSDR